MPTVPDAYKFENNLPFSKVVNIRSGQPKVLQLSTFKKIVFHLGKRPVYAQLKIESIYVSQGRAKPSIRQVSNPQPFNKGVHSTVELQRSRKVIASNFWHIGGCAKDCIAQKCINAPIGRCRINL